MTVKELIGLLGNENPDAIVDVRVEGQADGDWEIDYVQPLDIPQGPNAGSWVTLVLEGER